MAGLYIHIPFCRKACFYCDFHFTVSLKNKNELIECILKEAGHKQKYLDNETVQTIYFGGGTPSVLSIGELNSILKKIYKTFDVCENPEITLEANPDDLSGGYLRSLKKETVINRLSVGIQSFNDKELIWMNRGHNADQARECIENARQYGFDNINIDLIYGLPGSDNDLWKLNLEKAMGLNIQHISAYHLTIEPGSIFGRRHKKGFINDTDENESLLQFETLLDISEKHGFKHYEISNFAKPGFYSKHNLNYWQLGKYIGLGPSAHSYNGNERQWNVKVNSDYIKFISSGGDYYEKEILTPENKYNEYILTGLRTQWGVDLEIIKNKHGNKFYDWFLKKIEKYIKSENVVKKDKVYILSRKGKFIADGIAQGLFV